MLKPCVFLTYREKKSQHHNFFISYYNFFISHCKFYKILLHTISKKCNTEISGIN